MVERFQEQYEDWEGVDAESADFELDEEGVLLDEINGFLVKELDSGLGCDDDLEAVRSELADIYEEADEVQETTTAGSGYQAGERGVLQANNERMESRKMPTAADNARSFGLLDQARAANNADLIVAMRQRIMEDNLPLVMSIAREFYKNISLSSGRSYELMDVFQEGVIGMDRAIDKFEPQRGFAFSTYAYFWIKQNIERQYKKRNFSMRRPEHLFNVRRRFEKKLEEDSEGFGKMTHAQRAESLQVTPETLDRANRKPNYVRSLDDPILDGESTVANVIPDRTTPSPEVLINNESIVELLEGLIERAVVSENSKELIRKYFGLDEGGETRTIAEIMREMDNPPTHQAIASSINAGVGRMKRYAAKRGVVDPRMD